MNPLAVEPTFAVPTLSEAGSIAARLLVAAALGGLLGYERERVGKAAGLRTHMLVALCGRAELARRFGARLRLDAMAAELPGRAYAAATI